MAVYASFGLGALVGISGAIGITKWRPQKEALEQGGLLHSEQDVKPVSRDTLHKYGYPELYLSTHMYTGHTLTYDRCKKTPVWVAEVISKDMVKSSMAKRKFSRFQPDPRLPSNFSSNNTDYRKSGWSRGHMAPAGNYKHCQKSMDDTFYLTNIVPQDVNNNSGYWNRLEQYCRDLTHHYNEVRIISGPLFLPQKDNNTGKMFVKYEVIGDGCVAVPTHLFKIVLAESTADSSPTLGVFIIPNQPLGDVDLSRFQVSLEKLESYTGTTFHSKLDRSKCQDLCRTNGCKLMSLEREALIYYSKKIHSAQSYEHLDNVMKEMKEKGIEPDDRARQLYHKRMLELGDQNNMGAK